MSEGDFAGRLMDGEKVLWSGRPGQGVFIQRPRRAVDPVQPVADGFAIWTPAPDSVPQFLGIENSRGVFDQIQRAIGRAA